MAIRGRNRPSAEFSLATISDIVFLLLIFFMVTSTFVNQAGIKIEYPESKSKQPSDGTNTVTISADGRYFWNSTEIPAEEVRARIEPALTDDNPENDVVTLQVDRAVTYEQSMVVMSAVAEFGGSVVIATKKKN